MKRVILSAACAAMLLPSLTSCMGSMALTKQVYSWNEQIGNKFVNEVVFFCFWILPVYEVCGAADLLVLNSIEFWSGNNPMTASTKVVDTDEGRFLICCDGKGYDVKCEETGRSYRLDFTEQTQTWSMTIDEKEYPLMTFVDDTHVSMPTPDGSWTTVELSHSGVMAYRAICVPNFLAQK